MSGSGPTLPSVHHRKTFKRLNQMNGDLLPNLKKPLCSEVGREVIGQNAGCDATCQRLVKLSFKERNIALDKVKRSQDAVFHSYLKRYKQQKICQRKTYQDMQELQRLEAAKARAHRRFRRQDSAVEEVDPVTAVEGANKQAAVDEKANGGLKDLVRPGNQGAVKSEQVVLTLEDSPNSKGTTSQIQPNPPDDRGRQFDSVIDTDRVNKDSSVTDSEDTTHRSQNVESDRHNQRSTGKTYQKSKVLSVRKESLREPAIQERIGTNSEGNDNNESSRVTKADPRSFPRIDDLLLDKRESNHPQFTAGHSSTPGDDVTEDVTSHDIMTPPRRRRHGSVQAPLMVDPLTGHKRSIGLEDLRSLPVILEGGVTNQGQVQPRTQRLSPPRPNVSISRSPNPHGLSSWSHRDSISREYSSSSSDSEGQGIGRQTGYISMVQRNKMVARERERQRRLSLDREEPIVYVKNPRGDIVPSGVSFKRAEFQPPSHREKHFQQKMLRAQQEARVYQRDKLESFFDKIFFEERQMQRKREQVQMEQPQEEKKKRKASKPDMGFSLSNVMAAFQQHQAIPDDIDPDSEEGLKNCRYVRLHSPMTEEEKIQARRNRRGSWAPQPGHIELLNEQIKQRHLD